MNKREYQTNIRLTEAEYYAAFEACRFLDVTMAQVARKAFREVAREARAKGWDPEKPIDIQGVV